MTKRRLPASSSALATVGEVRDRGHGIPWKGNYSSWLEQKENRLKQEESAESARYPL